jgi:hypothetical protein
MEDQEVQEEIQFQVEDQALQVEVVVMIMDQVEDQEILHLQVHHKEIVEDHLEALVVVAEVELAKLVTLMVKAKEAMVQPLQLQVLQ